MDDPLAPGTRLGPYEIGDLIGAGGMGHVYRARDPRLNRHVAIKTLAGALAADPDGVLRFEREARAAGALHHPNVLVVYDVGREGDVSYIVSELLDGETVRASLNRLGALPEHQVIEYAVQIAQGLAAAHARGIIHRDLKPENLFVTRDRRVKILDFGIAKLISPADGKDPATVTDALTALGVVVGTVGYMAPEQILGEKIDPRADIFALGVVMHEMLSGTPPFERKTAQATQTAILADDPPDLAPRVTPGLVRVVRRCLEKTRDDRFHSAHDLGLALDLLATTTASGRTATANARSNLQRLTWIALAAIVATLVFISPRLLSMLVRSEARTVARFDVTPADGLRPQPAAGGVDIAISRDGTSIVYVGDAPGGGTQLWRRDVAALESTPVPGTGGATSPTLSPDGMSVAYGSGGVIRVLSFEGGPPLTVVASGIDPDWGADGMIYFSHDDIIHRVPAAGGDPETLTAPTFNALHKFPDVLPDGRGLLLTVYTGTPAQARIAVAGPEGGEVREILTGTMARYATTGHIIYATAGGTLLAAPFDVRRLEVTGPSVALAEGVTVSPTAASRFALSESGSLLYAVGPGSTAQLVWVSREGLAELVDSLWKRAFNSPVLSPDGRRLAVAIEGEASRDIWVKQLDRGPSTRLTFDGTRSDYPTWTPDGASVSYASNQAGPSYDLWTRRADGTGQAVLELDTEWALAEALWSPDGTWLVHRTSTNNRGAGDILAGHPHSKDKPLQLAATTFTEVTPAISPNGRWLAYASNESGRFEIFVVPFPEAGTAKWPISVGGGYEPRWSRDTHEIFYRNGRGELVAVPVETEPAFSAGQPAVLFSASEYLSNVVHQAYDVTPDGQRFLMIRPEGAGLERRLILVENFFEELRTRVPR